MIEFHSETDFALEHPEQYQQWIQAIIESEGGEMGALNYIFCDDAYLHQINVDYLNHDDYTDIISFDYSEGKLISGDIFISVERVQENAQTFCNTFLDELHRVMAHGLLHYLGYKDKTEDDALLMRQKEEEKMKLFHVER